MPFFLRGQTEDVLCVFKLKLKLLVFQSVERNVFLIPSDDSEMIVLI